MQRDRKWLCWLLLLLFSRNCRLTVRLMYGKHVPQLLHGLTYMNNCYLKDYEQNVTFFLNDTFIGDVLQASEFLGYFKRRLKCEWVFVVCNKISITLWVWLHTHFWARVWHVRGSHSQRNAGSGDCPCLTHRAMGPCCRCFLPSVICRGEKSEWEPDWG